MSFSSYSSHFSFFLLYFVPAFSAIKAGQTSKNNFFTRFCLFSSHLFFFFQGNKNILIKFALESWNEEAFEDFRKQQRFEFHSKFTRNLPRNVDVYNHRHDFLFNDFVVSFVTKLRRWWLWSVWRDAKRIKPAVFIRLNWVALTEEIFKHFVCVINNTRLWSAMYDVLVSTIVKLSRLIKKRLES